LANDIFGTLSGRFPSTNIGISLTTHHPAAARVFATSSVPVPGTTMLRNGTEFSGAVFDFVSLG
jgi:hypothetical protein